MKRKGGKRLAIAENIDWSAYTHVSLDIFDTTLLRRTRMPTDIFHLMCHYTLDSDQFGSWRYPDGFARLRQEAEKIARINAWTHAKSYEVTLDEIYHELAKLIELPGRVETCLKKIELRAERDNLFANEYLRGIFNSAYKHGIKILFISDIYHDREFIADTLSSLGYSGYNALYLSSETRLSKASGTLFRFVMEDQKISPERWLHIGDNIESDVMQPNSIGIDAFYYEKCLARIEKEKILSARLKSSLSGANPSVASLIYGASATKFFTDPNSSQSRVASADSDSLWYAWGYIHAGPLLLGFLQWLFASAIKNNAEAIYFLARDGFFVKQAFDQLYANRAPHIPTHYMYASRRLFNVAAITSLDAETVGFLTSGTSCLTVASFLERISIRSICCPEQIRSSGFENDQVYVRSGRDYACLRELMHAIEPLILAQAEKERILLRKYFHQIGLDRHSKTLIVDLGWHGSLQVSLGKLNRLFGYNTELQGRYLGTFPRAAEYTNEGHDIQGFLCDAGIPEANFRDIRKCVEIYEWLFSAPHGTICGLREDCSEIVPTYADSPMDTIRWNSASEAQRGALTFLHDISSSIANTNLVISATDSNRLMASFLTLPTFKEACLFGDIPHEEGFGGLGNTRFVAKPDKRIHMRLNPYVMYKETKTSFWKKGYLKRRRVLSGLARFMG